MRVKDKQIIVFPKANYVNVFSVPNHAAGQSVGNVLHTVQRFLTTFRQLFRTNISENW